MRFRPQTWIQRPKLRRALKMVVTVSGSKRPTCQSCSKPASTCLCNRIRNPGLENKVSVTILQHSLEKKHPLNSARIAKLGLKNVTVATVSDANFGARFEIRLLESGGTGSDSVQVLDFEETQKQVSVQNDGLGSGNSDLENVEEKRCDFADSSVELEETLKQVLVQNDGFGPRKSDLENLGEKRCEFVDSGVECSSIDDINGMLSAKQHSLEPENVEFIGISPVVKRDENEKQILYGESDATEEAIGMFDEKPVITITIGKYGYVSLLTDVWMTETDRQKLDLRSDLDKAIPSLPGIDSLAQGFVVKKLQKRPLKGGIELEECEEFELRVPSGSVLLFPSEEAIGVDGLKLKKLEVKNLIVLDGTWAKAKRMYNENPWLKLLPHLILDLDKMSLYAEVRSQPKAGYLSTIESVVYAMKAIGDDHEELDDLLDVFESMVGDQRRGKDARLSKESIDSTSILLLHIMYSRTL